MSELIVEALTMPTIRDGCVRRILTGATTEFDDVMRDILWAIGTIEPHDDLPPTIREVAEMNSAEGAWWIAEEVWNHCYERSRSWADKASDAIRVMEVFKVLETRGIRTGMFTTWDLLLRNSSAAGAALVGENEWEVLEPDDESMLLIRVQGMRQPTEQVAQQVIDALAEQGLTGRVVSEGVEVPVHWRWPVEPGPPLE